MDLALWKKWTINCAAGELLGIGFAGAVAFVVNKFIGEPQLVSTKLLVLLCMMGAGFVEGLLLGSFQYRVLKIKFPGVPKKTWLFYTILVAVIGWFLGMLPSLFMAGENVNANSPTSDPNSISSLMFAVLSIGSGLILGAIFGVFQWIVLRKYVKRSYTWIIANALGWAAGLGWIYLFASMPTENTGLAFNVAMGILGGLLAGLSVGAVTGLFLVKLESISPELS